MRRESLIISACIPVVFYIALASWLTDKHLFRLNSLLVWSSMIVYGAGQHLVIHSGADANEEVRRFQLLPVELTIFVKARQLASALVLGTLTVVTIGSLAAITRSPFAEIIRALLFVSSSLPSLIVLGWAPIWPTTNDLDAPLVAAGLFVLVVGISSLPFFIALQVLHNELWCLVWIAGFIPAWNYVFLPKCSEWVFANILGSEAS